VAAVDGGGLLIAVGIPSASPHEVKVLKVTLDDSLLDELPERLIGDKAYDSDKLDERLWDERAVKLIAPHRRGRKRPATMTVGSCGATSDAGRRSASSSGSIHPVGWSPATEVKAENFLGFLRLACAFILLRQF